MRSKFCTGVFAALAACCVWAQDKQVFKDDKEKVSYCIGVSVGSNWKRQGVEVDLDAVNKGIKEGLGSGPTLLTEQEIRDVLTAYQQKAQAVREDLRKQLTEENKRKAEAFLAENKTKPGVITSESGLQYKILVEGTRPPPRPNDTVTVNYRGTLLDGAEFDSSEKRGQPMTAPVSRGIWGAKGCTEALEKMKQGAKWQLFIPPNLAFGDTGNGPIPPGALLIVDVEMFTNAPPPPPPASVAPLTSDIIKVPSLEEMKKGAKIETIKAEDLEKLQQKHPQQDKK